MKRILTVFLIICFTLSPGMTVSASESEEQDVYAKYIDGNIAKATAPVEDGKADVELPDGTTVEVRGIPGTAAKLEIIPVPESEAEAYAWFTVCLEDTGIPLAVYDIYFLNADGDRINADGATVTIDCPSYESELVVCSVSTDETTKVLPFTIEDGRVTFTTDGSSYYVLAEKKAESTTDPGTTPDDPANPPTGDDTMVWPWIVLVIVAICAIFFLPVWKRRKRANG